jgi:ferredoxin
MQLSATKMGPHEWSYSNRWDGSERRIVPSVDLLSRFKNLNVEVELGFSVEQVATEVERCLNCDAQTVFTDNLCIECDACIDICPVDCLGMLPAAEEDVLRQGLKAPASNPQQPLFVSGPLKHTARLMVKDENICVHCGLCAERCPTGAWDMQKSKIIIPYAADHSGNAGCQAKS